VGHRHVVRIRYADCDMQGVVYNAHYLTFIDDGFDQWLRQLDTDFETALGWEVMLKKCEITWVAPARFNDHLAIEAAVGRWGNTSLDVNYSGQVEGRAVFDATVTYVTVGHQDYRPIPIPAALRDHLSR
jgi:acyl-CoA thioester hydrolase